MLYLVSEGSIDSWQIFGIATSAVEAEKLKQKALEEKLASPKLITIEEFEENTFYRNK